MEKVLKQEDKWETAKMQNLLEDVVSQEDVVEDLDEVLEINLKNPKSKMPRPCKRRRVRGRPNSSYFKPAGKRISELKESILTIEEFEAIRLNDLLNLEQNKCAEKMEISQPTFHRLISSAHYKIADAIINGKAIKIK